MNFYSTTCFRNKFNKDRKYYVGIVIQFCKNQKIQKLNARNVNIYFAFIVLKVNIQPLKRDIMSVFRNIEAMIVHFVFQGGLELLMMLIILKYLSV